MKTQVVDYVYKGFWKTLDWIYPPVCASCGEPGFRLCADCQVKIRYLTGKRCVICGEPLKRGCELCADCQANPPPYRAMRNLAVYEGVMRDCIHALKYDSNQGLGEFFCDSLAALVAEGGWAPDLVMPVPLSPMRMAERGYNQAACIAKPLAARLGRRYHPFGIERIRDTPSQVGLSGEARRRNVAGAFKAHLDVVAGKVVLMVDDVMTTGSTMEACAGALLDAGAEGVYCLTLGRFALRAGVPNLTRHLV
ncbi:MAG: ComF family protein [Brevefilum sp.]|nr:ComF family protein [Brevefilum sp.]